jgi:hypothetical protein
MANFLVKFSGLIIGILAHFVVTADETIESLFDKLEFRSHSSLSFDTGGIPHDEA